MELNSEPSLTLEICLKSQQWILIYFIECPWSWCFKQNSFFLIKTIKISWA